MADEENKVERVEDELPPEPETKSLSMEEKISECRRQLQMDPINKANFERRYRPDLERMESVSLVWDDEMAALRRFQVAGRVYELVEFLICGATDLALLINFQTQKILEFSRYIDAEVTLVDQMQNESDKLGGVRT